MSHFICEHCGAVLYDSPTGYVTGCEHYPIEKESKNKKDLMEQLIEKLAYTVDFDGNKIVFNDKK